jgi:hypothetical protein
MKRTVALIALVGATLVAPAAARAPKPPARMLVYAQEWSLWPSRPSLPAGKVVVELWNRGQDAHDLRIRRLRNGHATGPTQGVKITESGALSQSTWQLKPGRYVLYCSMPGHYAKGMHTTLVVK